MPNPPKDRWCNACKIRTSYQCCPICWHRYGRAYSTRVYDPTKHKEPNNGDKPQAFVKGKAYDVLDDA